MGFRGMTPVLAGLAAGMLSMTSCTAPDPAAISFAERPGSVGEVQGNGSTTSSSTSTSSSSSGGEAGADPIFNGAAFAYVDPGQKANDASPANHAGNVEGKDCVSAGCHLNAGTIGWLFAGTLYSASQGGTTIPKGEIKIVGPDNAEIAKAYTDANGNFWIAAGGKTIPAGSKVGVRKEGGQVKTMATPIANADASCNANRGNCHGTASQGKVFAP